MQTVEELNLEIERLHFELAKKNEITELDKRITNILYQLRILASIKGFHFIKEAIKKLYFDHSAIDIQVMILYKEVAKHFNETPSKVERALRHAIEAGWSSKSESFKLLNHYLEDEPTNKEFLALMVNYLRMNQ